MNAGEIQKKHKEFVYKGFDYKTVGTDLKIWFNFSINPDLKFTTEIIIKNIEKSELKDIDNLVFHLGLIEMLNYWKLTCSPIIKIEAGNLDKQQITFLKRIIINGMGQYFYENKIDFRKPKFLEIIVNKNKPQFKPLEKKLNNKRVLVPIGGGKDAPVTLKMLDKQKKNIGSFVLNAIKPQKDIIRIARLKENIFIERKLDSKLFALNKKGLLNGHVPFSAFLSFLSILLAEIFDYGTIAFSWEKSADEGNVKYQGKWINHQWSKSSEFEKMMQNYAKKYLLKNIKIYSPLRKLSEIEIIKKFAGLKQYHPFFLSCNNAYKTKNASKRWCGKCAKCLFVFSALYAFVEKKDMIKIFGKNLFEDKKLVPLMEQLIGEKAFKPFECVGTISESKKIIKSCIEKERHNLPIVLKKISETIKR
ncbi:hypothetical protein KJ562_02935 [Patescibacteria group bacterium]|nr:hypothetical protein [Patescibacteria group bacterium]MBU4162166.1 hypothetical protein [Patescibacteria group bacterium]